MATNGSSHGAPPSGPSFMQWLALYTAAYGSTHRNIAMEPACSMELTSMPQLLSCTICAPSNLSKRQPSLNLLWLPGICHLSECMLLDLPLTIAALGANAPLPMTCTFFGRARISTTLKMTQLERHNTLHSLPCRKPRPCHVCGSVAFFPVTWCQWDTLMPTTP